MDERPIGVFDSGLGGLTAVRQLKRLLPEENIVYFGDTGRVPYGTRGRDTIIRYARQDVRLLLSHDLKAIVVACGTVSSVALSTLREEFSVPIFGVIGSPAERAAKITKNGKIGVIATPATIKSGAFQAELALQDKNVKVFAKPCPLFVPLVENGRFQKGDPVTTLVAREYLEPLLAEGIDTLIMGCTHFPLLRDILAEICGEGVTLVDPGAETAALLLQTLEKQGLRAPKDRTGWQKYLVSDSTESFAEHAASFLGEPVECVSRVAIEEY